MKARTVLIVILLFLVSCEKYVDTETLKFYGDAWEDIGYSIAQSGERYLLCGQHEAVTREGNKVTSRLKKLAVIETDKDGNQLIRKTTINNMPTAGRKVISLDDGSSVAAGYIDSASTKLRYLYIVKFTAGSEGYTEKAFDYPGMIPGNVYANDIIKTTGGYLVLATTDIERGASDDTGNQKGRKDILLLSLTEDLQVIRSIQYGFTGDDEGVAIKADRMGGYVVVGTTDRYRTSTGTDLLVLSVNEDITNVSTKSGRFIQLPDDQNAADLEVTSDGYLIAGNTISAGESRGYVWKITGTIWGAFESHVIQFPGLSEPFTINAVCSYRTNSFLMAGQYGPATSGSMLIFTTDLLGYPVEGKRRVAGGTGNQVAYDVLADGDDIVVVGKNQYENNSMISFLKFRF